MSEPADLEATLREPPRHSVSVAAIVADRRGRVLSIRRRDNGRWETPGGVLELSEEIQDGVAREVYEETGVTIEPIRLTGVYKNVEHAIVMLVFLARQVAGNPQSTEEAAEAAWLTLEDVQERMLPEHVDRVLDAFGANVPVFRSYGDPSLSIGR
jgi:8-oxo-dGTP diphosphatase